MFKYFMAIVSIGLMGCAGNGGGSGGPAPDQGSLVKQCRDLTNRIELGECLFNFHADVIQNALDELTTAQNNLVNAQDNSNVDVEFPQPIKDEADGAYSGYRVAVQSAVNDLGLFNIDDPYLPCTDGIDLYLGRTDSGSAAYTHNELLLRISNFIALDVAVPAERDEAYAELGLGLVSVGLHHLDQLLPVMQTCFLVGPNS